MSFMVARSDRSPKGERWRRWALVSMVVAAAAQPLVGNVPPLGCPSRLEAEDLKKATVGYMLARGQLCSATLLSRHVVITAAHCVEGRKPEEVLFSLAPDLDEKRGPFAVASRIELHPGFIKRFNKEYGGADLALVQLSSHDYGGSPRVFYTPAETDSDLTAGATAFVIGYGLNPDAFAGVRRSRQIRFAGRQQANLRDGTKVPGGVLRFARGDSGDLPCGGDSGSPVLKFIGSRTAIVAIHSASMASAPVGSRGFRSRKSHRQICRISSDTYDTSVPAFRDWVEKQWRKLETDEPKLACP